MDWKTIEWSDFLVGKIFEDEGRWKIVKVQYNREKRSYTCDVEQDDEENKMLLLRYCRREKARLGIENVLMK